MRYLLPVKVLGKLFRGKFLAALESAYRNGEIDLAGRTAELADPVGWAALRDRLYRKSWVVYAKAPFGGAEHVFRYLGRYTHRVAISNHRILGIADGTVTFSIKDYRDQAKKKRMTLTGVEFLRRFLLHVLPKGFVRIRHYGLCAGRNVDTKLAAARLLLQPALASKPAAIDPPTPTTPWWERFRKQTGIDMMACPLCGGRLFRRRALVCGNARASPVAA